MFKLNLVLVSVAWLSSFQGFAGADFKLAQECGAAKVVSGDTCSNVKVEFDIKDCTQSNEPPRLAQKIICKDKTIKARYQEAGYRFEAEFTKIDNGWGAVIWSSLGPVKKWEKIVSASIGKEKQAPLLPENPVSSTNNAPEQVEREPAKVAVPIAQSESPISAFKFSGFFDFRYTDYHSRHSINAINPHAESGFGLEDGAFYMGYEREKVSVVVDLPFRRGKDVDYNSSTAVPQQSSASTIKFGADRAQLFVKYRITEDLAVNFGQFDTFLGVELNDSKDRVFGKTGLVFDTAIPNTHTGLLVEYTKYGGYIKAMAVDPSSKGSYGTATTGDNNTEYGGAIGYANDFMRTQVGHMARPILKADQSDYNSRVLTDVTLGFTFGRFSIDFEHYILDDPSKNTLTPTNLTDKEQMATGTLALASYKLMDNLTLSARYERTNHDPAALNVKEGESEGGSVNFQLAPDLKLRTEYINYDFRGVNDQRWHEHRMSFSALVSF